MKILALFIQEPSRMAEGLAQYGAIGICLVALSIWYIVKDRRYEKRIDERFAREAEFQRELAGLSEKYRVALEKVSSALEVAVNFLRGKGGTP